MLSNRSQKEVKNKSKVLNKNMEYTDELFLINKHFDQHNDKTIKDVDSQKSQNETALFSPFDK